MRDALGQTKNKEFFSQLVLAVLHTFFAISSSGGPLCMIAYEGLRVAVKKPVELCLIRCFPGDKNP